MLSGRSKVARIFEQMDEREALLNALIGPSITPEIRPRITPIVARPTEDEVLLDVRLEVEEYLAVRSPRALLCLDGARDAIRAGSQENLAHAAVSCRRALEAIADAVWPPEKGVTVKDRHGHELEVGVEQFRNRLALFFERRVLSKSRRAHDIADLDALDKRLKLLIQGAGKGVHGDLDLGDARRLYLATIQMLAEMAQHDLY